MPSLSGSARASTCPLGSTIKLRPRQRSAGSGPTMSAPAQKMPLSSARAQRQRPFLARPQPGRRNQRHLGPCQGPQARQLGKARVVADPAAVTGRSQVDAQYLAPRLGPLAFRVPEVHLVIDACDLARRIDDHQAVVAHAARLVQLGHPKRDRDPDLARSLRQPPHAGPRQRFGQRAHPLRGKIAGHDQLGKEDQRTPLGPGLPGIGDHTRHVGRSVPRLGGKLPARNTDFSIHLPSLASRRSVPDPGLRPAAGWAAGC